MTTTQFTGDLQHVQLRHDARSILSIAAGWSAVYFMAAVPYQVSEVTEAPVALPLVLAHVVALGLALLAAKGSRHASVIIIAVVYFVVSCLDLALTIRFIVRGSVEELNPIAKQVIELTGVPGLAIFKVALTLLPGILMLAAPAHRCVLWLAVAALLVSGLLVGAWTTVTIVLFGSLK